MSVDFSEDMDMQFGPSAVHKFIFSPPLTRGRSRRESMDSNKSMGAESEKAATPDSPAKHTRLATKKAKYVYCSMDYIDIQKYGLY